MVVAIVCAKQAALSAGRCSSCAGPDRLSAWPRRASCSRRPRPRVRFLFDRRDHFEKRGDVGGADAPRNRLLEIDEIALDPRGNGAAGRGQRDEKRAAIFGSDRAGDQTAIGEAIEDAGERRPLVREAVMELGDRRRRGRREQREDVRLALRQARRAAVGQVEPDPMRRAMDVRNEAK